jgi:DNA repair protein RadC
MQQQQQPSPKVGHTPCWAPDLSSTADLIACIQQSLSAVKQNSTTVLEDFLHADLHSLQRLFGTKRGLAFAAYLELQKRAHETTQIPKRADSPEAVSAWARGRLAALDHEELWSLSINQNAQVLSARKLAQGGSASLSISARDVLRAALKDGAHGLILVHNHPSGDPSPSEADRIFTRTIATAARIVGIALVDHVVVGSQGFVSMKQLGLYDDHCVARNHTESAIFGG